MKPIVALAATLLSVASLILLSPRWGGTVYAGLLIIILVIVEHNNSARSGRQLLVWTGPFVVPLLAIHGILNPQFPVTDLWLGLLPVRAEGLAYGYDLALRVLLLSVVGAYWLSVDRDEMVESLIRLKLPTPLILLAMQGFVMGRLIQERIQAIHLAQRARGIPVSASIGQRIKSTPALLIPVVVGTFVEAEARVPVLLAHGYGRLEPSARPSDFDLRTVAIALTMLVCLALVWAGNQIW